MIAILKRGATKEEMDDISAKFSISKGVDTKKYCGVIKLKKDPVVIQKKMRRDWE